MERLYTPWRLKYIDSISHAKDKEQKADATCLFCRVIGEDPGRDRGNLVLIRAALAFVVLNKYPYNCGHLMVLPNRHVGDITDLTVDEHLQLSLLSSVVVKALRRIYRPHAFNLGINMGEVAGGSIAQHLHVHVVPRWQGDTNFMPIIGATKTLPEELITTFDRIRHLFNEDHEIRRQCDALQNDPEIQ